MPRQPQAPSAAPMMSRGRARRLASRHVGMALLLSALMVLGGVLLYLWLAPISQPPYLRYLAERQHSHQNTLQPARGRIPDRHGRVLATSVPVPSFCAIPVDIEDPDAFAPKVAAILGQPLATVQRQ